MSGVGCRRCGRILEGGYSFATTFVDGCRWCSGFGDDIDTGTLDLGLERESTVDTRNDFVVFYEEFLSRVFPEANDPLWHIRPIVNDDDGPAPWPAARFTGDRAASDGPRDRVNPTSREGEPAMSGIICKLFVQARRQAPNGDVTYELGAVCRGDENKTWAAATPSGVAKQMVNPVLDDVWDARLAGAVGNPEVHVVIRPSEDGSGWAFEKCEHTWGGVAVRFSLKEQPWSTIELTVNNSAATKTLRELFAQSMIDGAPARVAVTVGHVF